MAGSAIQRVRQTERVPVLVKKLASEFEQHQADRAVGSTAVPPLEKEPGELAGEDRCLPWIRAGSNGTDAID